MAVLLVAAALLAGCATVPTGPRVTVMPGPQKSLPEFQNDQMACQQFAQASIGGTTAQDAAANSAAASAVAAAALGAAAGAIIGSATGQAGAGAAWGAGTGLLWGSAAGVNAAGYTYQEAQRRYDIAYMQCMYTRGNQVPGQVALRSMPPRSAAPSIPPPNTPPPSYSGSGSQPRIASPRPPLRRAAVPAAPTSAPPSAAPGYGVPAGPIQPGPPMQVAPPAEAPIRRRRIRLRTRHRPRLGSVREPLPVLARRVEADLRPALHRDLQVELVGREVHRIAVDVGRERRRVVALEVAAHLLVGIREPARGRDARVVVDRVDLVLAREARGDDLELQLADRAQQQRVADHALEHLDRAFLAELLQALRELLRLERVARARDAEQLGREVRDALVARAPRPRSACRRSAAGRGCGCR